jgi:L-amino acid N-acyltransferase YncA
LVKMQFSIRRVREEDAGSIVELLNPIIQAGKYTIMDEPVSVDDQIGFIRGFPERGVYHAAVRNDSQEVLGIQDVQPISTEVNALRHVGEISTFVRLDSLRNGIGRSLSDATFQAAREKGFLKIRATIRADNPQAISFYKSQGFEVIGTAQKHAFVGEVYIDEILMERFIDYAPR